MSGFWFALLLFLAHGPAPAAVTVSLQDQTAPWAAESGMAALHPTLGLELVRGRGVRGTGERSGTTSLGKPVRSDAALVTARILRCSSEATRTRAGALFPRFEHLPYFATAPPFPR